MALVKKNRLLVAILILAFALRFIGLLPNIAHPDEGVLQIYSWNLVKNVFSSGDFNPHIFKYGSLNFYAHALVSMPVFLTVYLVEIANSFLTSSFSRNFLPYAQLHDVTIAKYGELLFFAGRGLTASLGVLVVYVGFLVGKKLFGKGTGLISAALLAISPLLVRDSHYATADTPLLLAIFVSFYLLLNLVEKKTFKWYALSGLILGVSVTIKFFPIAFVAYPVALIFSFEKKREYLFKVLTSLFFVFVGLFIGLPYLFLDPNGLNLFVEDLGKYALPWYGNPITNFLFRGEGDFSLKLFLPQRFQPFFINFLTFNAFGVLPTLFSVIGVFLLLFRNLKKFILLFMIPALNFLYITAYMPVYYERLLIPTLGFLVFFAAYGIARLVKKPNWLMAACLLTFVQPFYISSTSSIACNQSKIEKQSGVWIEENISPGSAVSYMPEVTFPAIELEKLVRLQPNTDFSFEEVRNLGVDYSFINAGKLDYYDYMYFLHYFPPPKEAILNSHLSLSLAEYFSRAELLETVEKPPMCDNSRVYYFSLPKEETEGSGPTEETTFTRIQKFGRNDEADIVVDSGRTIYTQRKAGFTPPRLMTEKIGVSPDQSYKFDVWIKTDRVVDSQQVYLRADFYNRGYENVKERLEVLAKKAWLLFNYGLTQPYHEKLRLIEKDYTNVNLPGKAVFLSPRIKPTANWQKLEVAAVAPDEADSVIFSLSTDTNDPIKLFIDRAQLQKP